VSDVREVVAPVGLGELTHRVEAVQDPELPILTLGQLGVIRGVSIEPAAAGSAARLRARVDVTPTYSGCPAMEVIQADIADVVVDSGYDPDVRLVLSPPWTTDWISPAGRTALQDAGIAPPSRAARGPVNVELGRRGRSDVRPACPQCGSVQVEEIARFGSTACKALWRCLACREPFDYVKPI
jgi:ring-1,2-phenylacetyl-CoA epoxidase subunit PaaD